MQTKRIRMLKMERKWKEPRNGLTLFLLDAKVRNVQIPRGLASISFMLAGNGGTAAVHIVHHIIYTRMYIRLVVTNVWTSCIKMAQNKREEMRER